MFKSLFTCKLTNRLGNFKSNCCCKRRIQIDHFSPFIVLILCYYNGLTVYKPYASNLNENLRRSIRTY